MARSRALVLALTSVALMAAATSADAVTLGRLNILREVHGYNADGKVLVPLRGIAEWLGAQVEYTSPDISIALGDSTVRLSVGATQASVDGRPLRLFSPAQVYGTVTCVPLRFVGEALGLQVEYHQDRSDEWYQVGMLPVVTLRGHGKLGRVLIHQEPPNVVAKVIDDLEFTTQRDYGNIGIDSFRLARYATDWTVEVTRIWRGHFYAGCPASWSDEEVINGKPGFMVDAWMIYAKRDGKWRAITGGQDVPSRRQWSRAGLSVDVARHFGLALADY